MNQGLIKFLKDHRRWLVALLVTAITSYVFLRRFPDNFYAANFYAEDGTIFAENIYRLGFWKALVTTFNGYYVWGMYLLTMAGMVLNRVIFGGEFVTLPSALALVSYGFMGISVSWPIIALKKYVPMLVLVWLAVISAFVPIPGSDYAIIGTIGNLKFLFVYIAFLLIVLRNWLPAGSKKIWFIDLGLLLCAYTNITVYALVPFALWRYAHLLSRKPRTFLAKAWHDTSFRSLVVLGCFMLAQLLLIRHFGLPETPGYLDSAYQWGATVEMFAARTYLYGLLFWTWSRMSDGLAVVLTLTLIVGSVWLAPRRLKGVVVFAAYTAFMLTFLFVIKRTGLSELYTGYQSSGPDQFFYTQNILVYCMVALAAAGLWQRLRRGWKMGVAVIMVLCLTALPLLIQRGYGNLGFKESVGSVRASTYRACQKDQDPAAVVVYPDERFTVDLPRALICSASVNSYQPEIVKTGLEPYQNNYLAINEIPVKQTFAATQNNLRGIRVYFSTFAKPVRTSLELRLLTPDCKKLVSETRRRKVLLEDNQFSAITFKPVAASKDQRYCFELKATDSELVAVQLSAPGKYDSGEAMVHDQIKQEDVVFDLLYEDHK